MERESERERERGRGAVRRQGSARSGVVRGCTRRQRQSSLSMNRSDCACRETVHSQRQEQLQVNSSITKHILITIKNTDDKTFMVHFIFML